MYLAAIAWDDIILLYGVLVVSLVFHEAAHALFALVGGDKTAYHGGQVTLNPIPHMKRSPFGTIVFPLAALFMSNGTACMGFASAPYDPHWAHRHPKRAALMAAAGPLANIVLVLIAVLVVKTLVWTDQISWVQAKSVTGNVTQDTSGSALAVARIAGAFMFLNIVLAVLNFFPWPPLDGASVLEGLFPKQLRGFYAYVRAEPMLFIAGLIGVFFLFQRVYPPVYFEVWDFFF